MTVPKPFIRKVPCVEKHAAGNQSRLRECLLRTESHWLLDNDPALVPPLLGFARENLLRANLCDETGLVRVTLALGEALVNAIVQGNLEIAAELWECDEAAYQHLVEQRRRQHPYRDRRVRVIAQELLHEARYVVRHDGPGPDVSALPDLDGPAMLNDIRARGLLLIRTCMDEVTHDATGKEITMVKRRDQ
jgi:anti-sigma regulatory factor (Ser/Thr protein kinase)